MARITQNGRALAHKLSGPKAGLVDAQVCSLICRSAATYQRIQECICNGSPLRELCSKDSTQQAAWDITAAQQEADYEKRDASLEAHLRKLVALLGEGFAPVFQGDPRGACLKIATPDGKYDDWGKDGICV